MKRIAALLALLFLPRLGRAGELSLYYLPNMAVQYEGTGYRQTPAGWELKVKPLAVGQGVRWRGGPWQVQYWRNNAYYHSELGNSASTTLNQHGNTLYAFDSFIADIRLPLAGTAVEAVGGVEAAQALFKRKDIVFLGVPESASATERLEALGPVVGFHGKGVKPLSGPWSLWADGEVLTGHFFWTHNRQRTDGGNLHRQGYSYFFRAEAGVRRGSLGLGAGYMRQAAEIVVPGGKSLPGGAAASLPVNQNDVDGLFASLSWVWP